MARIDNYFYADYETQRIIIRQEGIPYSLGGTVYGRSSFPDGSVIVTSPVQKEDDSIVVTAKGQEYILETMHPDYKELLEVHAAGIPIISCWRLDGNRRNKYTLSGEILGSTRRAFGKVERQAKNFVWLNGIQYYVIWHNLDKQEKESTDYTRLSIYCDLQLKNFEPYMSNPHARPYLL